MRKKISILLVLLMIVSVFAFTGCGKTEKAATDDTTKTAADTSLTDIQKAGVTCIRL